MNLVVNDTKSLNEYINAHKKGVWLVWYYAEWCGHCQMMAGSWDAFTKLLKKSKIQVNTAKIEDTMLSQLGISVNGFPTIELHKNGKISAEYSDERTPTQFLKFCKKHAKTNKSNRSLSKKKRTIRKKSLKKK